MVMASLYMHSVGCCLQRRSRNRPRFMVYPEVSYPLQQLQQHFHPQNHCYYILKKEAQMANLWPENTMPDTKSEVQHSCLRDTPGTCEKVRADVHSLIWEILCTKKVMWTSNSAVMTCWYTQAHSSGLSLAYLQKAHKDQSVFYTSLIILT